MGFDLTGAAVYPLALVFGRLVARQKEQRTQEQKCKEGRVDFAPALHRYLRGGVIDSP